MIGRLFGWTLILLAILAASAEAVMALGTGVYDGIATGEVWTLLSGQPMGVASGAPILERLMNLPAWLVMGSLGFILVVAFRRRPKRRMFSGQRGHAFH